MRCKINRIYKIKLINEISHALRTILVMKKRPIIRQVSVYRSFQIPVFYLPKSVFNLFMASLVFSCVEKAVKRKNPSPASPKPAPGVPTT